MCVKFLCKVPSDSKKQNQFPEYSFQRPTKVVPSMRSFFLLALLAVPSVSVVIGYMLYYLVVVVL